jgi:hypothetical protein
MERIPLFVAVLLTVAIVAVAGEAMSIEKLSYQTVEQDGPFELRVIESHVVAETFVEGRFEDVGSVGFRRLVAFIGGSNQTQTKISMAAPVVQEVASEKISMTAPVGQEKVGDQYRITFLMPSKYTIESLPQPTDERIRFRVEPEHLVAVVRYSGFWSRSRYADHERKLRDWIQQRGLESSNEAVWARYDPPFMPWFLRRNEIRVRVFESAGSR